MVKSSHTNSPQSVMVTFCDVLPDLDPTAYKKELFIFVSQMISREMHFYRRQTENQYVLTDGLGLFHRREPPDNNQLRSLF